MQTRTKFIAASILCAAGAVVLAQGAQPGGQFFYAVQLRGGVLVLGQQNLAHRPAPDRQQLEHGPPALHLVPAELAHLPMVPARPHVRSSRTTARQAMPSARPSAPKPSARSLAKARAARG